MKSILVPIEHHESIDSVLAMAVLLANSFGSYVEGMALRPALSPFLAADAIGGTVVYESQLDEPRARESQEAFEAFMGENGLVRGWRAGQPSFGWKEGDPAPDELVGSHARVFDLTVVGRPGVAGPRMSTLEAALFESGRPILIAPPIPASRIAEKVLIAWNRSTETARAIGFALPILKKAARVVVLTVKSGTMQGPSGDQVVQHLVYNGISAGALSIDAEGQSAGEAILSHAASIGADLVVKGAYTQSRLRQMIFGGATRHIISETNLPVFMAH